MKAKTFRKELLGRLAILACSSLIFLSGVGQTNQPQFSKVIMPDADTPVVLEWQSNPSYIYSVQYSVQLTNDWKTVAEGFPSQGTTTRWTDRGQTDPDNFRFTSADYSAPYRFYRLKVERQMDTSLPISVTITNLNTNSVVSGLINVEGTISATQALSSVKLLVDGYSPIRHLGQSTFSLPFDTRWFVNGSHRISVLAEDIGAVESAEEPNEYMDREASYGVTNVMVTFSNNLSNVRIRFEAVRPELSLTQEVFAVWSTPRQWQVDITPDGDPSTVYRSYTGEGRKILVLWDGNDSNGTQINPQIVAAQIYDLGEGIEPEPGGGGGSGDGTPAPSSFSNNAETSEPAIPPLPWDTSTWPQASAASESETKSVARGTATGDSAQKEFVTQSTFSGVSSASSVPEISIPFPFLYVGSFGVAGQGHHPAFGTYLTPPRFLGRVRMSSLRESGPWGPLRRVKGLTVEASTEFARMGYSVFNNKKLDDQVIPGDLKKDQPSNTNFFNRVNLGLFIGHSVAARDFQTGFNYRQSYVPIYNSTFNSMTFVGSSEMSFGSEQLKWMAFFSCNMFRDDLYRANGIYSGMLNNFAIPMNGNLHILQGYATEMSIHPDFVFWWTLALRNSSLVDPADRGVINAWNFACRRTQKNPNPNDPENFARSIFWPECSGDFIYGYGSQTTPNRDPEDPLEQADLEIVDGGANALDP